MKVHDEMAHPVEPSVQRDRALEGQVLEPEDAALVRDHFGLARASTETPDDLSGLGGRRRAFPDHELPGPGEVGAEQPAKEVLGEVPRTHVQGERCAAVDSVLSFANLSVVLGSGGASRRTPGPAAAGVDRPGLSFFVIEGTSRLSKYIVFPFRLYLLS